MKMKRSALFLAGGLMTALLFAPNFSHGETDPSFALAQEVITQQKTIVDNQAKIDAKIAEIAEELRLARIFVSRSGGGRK